MKTMGLTNLYLVAPKSYPHPTAYDLAAGADDILMQATVVDTLDEALHGINLVFATSARPRGVSLPGLTPNGCAKHVAGLPDNTQVAIVFGREHSGLTNEELLRCHYHVNIPSNPEYSSLNLAQAVQIVAYELRMELLSPVAKVECRQDELASADEVEQFYAHLTQVMQAVQFLKPTNPTRRLQQRIRRLFNRARLERMEVSILRGMLSQTQYALNPVRKKQEDLQDE
jgi:tRNA (cytidine32/uridine32-2'-O)-methyltransferase